jgi:3-deoxy-D-manno-octulosonic-acid transferase
VKARDGGIQVRDVEVLGRSLKQLLDQPERRESIGLKARQWVQDEQGIVQRDMAWIEKLIETH